MLFRQTLLYLPAQVIGPLAQFVAAIAWTYFLAPAALGVFAIVVAVQELVLLVTLSWWSSYTLRYFSGQDPARRLAHDRFEVVVHLAAALLQVAAIVLVLALVMDDAPSASLIVAALAYALTRNLTSHYVDRCIASFATVPFTILQVCGPLLGLLIGLILVKSSPTPEAILWGYAVAQVVGLAVAIAMRPLSTWRPAVDRTLFVAAFSYGMPLLASNLLSWAAVHGIRFIAEFELDAAAVGLVTVGWWLGLRATQMVGQLFLVATFNVAVERIRAVGQAAALPQLATNGALLLAVIVPTVAGMTVLGRPLVDHLVAAPYRDITAAILPLAALAGAIRVFGSHGPAQCFMLFEQPKSTVWIGAVDAATNLVFCFVGLKLGGLVGAVLGCLLATAATYAFAFVLARTRFGYFLRAGDLARIAIGTGAMTLVLLALPWEASRMGLTAEIAVGSFVYLMIMAALYPKLTRHAVTKLRQRIMPASAASWP